MRDPMKCKQQKEESGWGKGGREEERKRRREEVGESPQTKNFSMYFHTKISTSEFPLWLSGNEPDHYP